MKKSIITLSLLACVASSSSYAQAEPGWGASRFDDSESGVLRMDYYYGDALPTYTIVDALPTTVILNIHLTNDFILGANGNQFTLDICQIEPKNNLDVLTLSGKFALGTPVTNVLNFYTEDNELIPMETAPGLELNYNANQSPYITYKVSATVPASSVPEPTTATFSLLALAGLSARRRRK